MRHRSRVAKLWAQSPELAFAEVEDGILSNRVRSVAGLLESVLFEVEGVVPVDKKKARHYAEKCLSLAHTLAFSPKKQRTNANRVVAYAYAVLGRCMVVANQEELALIQFATAEQLTAVPADMRGCLATRRASALAQLRRFDEAFEAVDGAVEIYASCEVRRESEFNSLPMALLVRTAIGIYGHLLAVDTPRYGLSAVLADTRRALSLVRKGSPMENGIIPSVVGMFGYLVAVEGYTGEGPGVELSELEALLWRLELPAEGSVFDAQLRWIMGLVEIHGRGRGTGEIMLAKARQAAKDQGMVDVAVQITVDIQWFQLVTGRPDAAAQECKLITDSIPHMRFDQDLMRQWVDRVMDRSVGDEIVGKVFEEVRGLRGVSLRPSHSAGRV